MSKGWHNEPGRHKLASKGVKTALEVDEEQLTVNKLDDIIDDIVRKLGRGEHEMMIDGRPALLKVEGWDDVCVAEECGDLQGSEYIECARIHAEDVTYTKLVDEIEECGYNVIYAGLHDLGLSRFGCSIVLGLEKGKQQED